MESQDFLRNTSFDNSDDGVLYILGERKINNREIEYLVRYNNPQMYDVWVKNYELTCSSKILAYYRNENPPSLTPNLDPKSKNNAIDHDLPSSDDQFKIYGFEKKDDTIYIRVHIPGEEGIVIREPKDLYGNYAAEIADYYENNILSRNG